MKERSGMPYDVVAYEADELARLLSPAEEGLFHRMLRLAWMNGSIPADLTALAELCRVRPTVMKKAWPRLSKMWLPIEGNSTRLENKKQKSERIFLESKRDQAREAAKLKWKLQREKENANADALRTQSDRNASLPSPSQRETKLINNSSPVVFPPAEKRGGRPPDPAFEYFVAKHMEYTGTAYVPHTKDFVHLAGLRKANGIIGKGTPDGWEQGVENYFASPLKVWTLADFCLRFPTFRNSRVNEFQTPINHEGAKGNGRPKENPNERAGQDFINRKMAQAVRGDVPDVRKNPR